MTRRAGLLLAGALLGAWCASGTLAQQQPAEAPWAIAGYVCGDGDLTALAQAYARGMTRGALAGGWPMALQVDLAGVGSGARRRLLVVGADAQPRPAGCGPVASAQALADYLRWVADAIPAERLALVIYGHGASPGGLGADGTPAATSGAIALDADHADPLTAREVAQAIGVSGVRPDLLVLDCCFGASADNLWELRASCETLVVAAGRVAGAGISWQTALSALRPGDTTAEALGWAAARAGGDVSGGHALLRPAGITEVRDALAELRTVVMADPPTGVSKLLDARRRCADYGGGRELCDLRELSVRLSECADRELARAAEKTIDAVDACIIRGDGMGGGGGLTVLMPGGRMVVPGGYGAGAGDFGAESGWGEVLSACSRRERDLMERTTGNALRGEDPA